MKNLVLSASAVALLSVVFCGSEVAWGQAAAGGGAAAPAASAPHKVALIDMAYVFKNYKKFENLREDLKAEITQSEEEAKSKAMALQEMQKKMKTFSEGSAEFTTAEGNLAKSSAEFEAFRRAAQREFLKKESQIYHTVYMETADAVAMYANFYKFTLVMRFNREDLDTDNAQKLIEGMNRQVVFHRPEDDITLSVTEYLNKKFDKASAGGAPAAAPRSTQGAPKSATR
ncbi:MAG: OmpH family outer membrane protein [Planctomycetaceae bacterium]|nr:OmpH family outer membrane protein [Planctomycetaceae bacterium]